MVLKPQNHKVIAFGLNFRFFGNCPMISAMSDFLSLESREFRKIFSARIFGEDFLNCHQPFNCLRNLKFLESFLMQLPI